MTEPTGNETERGETDPGEVSDDAIARRAYEISQADDAGTSEEKAAAERELRDGAASRAIR